MYIRAIALALPLVMGIAACKTSSTTRGETASTTQPRTDQDRTASSGTTSTDTSATASGTAGGTMHGGAYGTGTSTGATASGTMSGTAAADDLKGHESDELVSGKVTKVSGSSIEIESAPGEQKTLQVVPETVVTIDGRDAHASELQEGQEVRASFNTVEGRDVAVQIKAGQDTGSSGMGTMHGGSSGTMHPGSTGTMHGGSGGMMDPGSTGTGTMHGGASAGTGGTASGTMSGTAAADDLKGHESDELVSGKVTKVSGSSIEIESAPGEQKTLQVVPETVVTIDGRDAQPSELQEGQEVRASFNTVDGRDVAVQIKAGQDTGSSGMGTMQGGSPGTMDPGSTGTTDPGSKETPAPATPGVTRDPLTK